VLDFFVLKSCQAFKYREMRFDGEESFTAAEVLQNFGNAAITHAGGNNAAVCKKSILNVEVEDVLFQKRISFGRLYAALNEVCRVKGALELAAEGLDQFKAALGLIAVDALFIFVGKNHALCIRSIQHHADLIDDLIAIGFIALRRIKETKHADDRSAELGCMVHGALQIFQMRFEVILQRNLAERRADGGKRDSGILQANFDVLYLRIRKLRNIGAVHAADFDAVNACLAQGINLLGKYGACLVRKGREDIICLCHIASNSCVCKMDEHTIPFLLYTLLEMGATVEGGILRRVQDLSPAAANYAKNELTERSLIMTKENIRAALANVKCFLLDMDGTFYLGDKLIDGSLDFLDALEKTGRTARFLTNNSSKSASVYAEKLAKMGVKEKYRDVISSGHAAAHYCLKKFPGGKCYLLGNPMLAKELSAMGLELTEDDPDYVLVAFDTTLDYAKLCKVCDYIRYGKPYIATHPDYNCPTETGFIPDMGAIMAFIEASTGRKADIILGKPNRGIVDEALMRTGYSLDEMAMVGDRLYTDVATGVNHGMKGILVLSGEATMDDVAVSDVKPDMIFGSLKDMIEYL